MASRVLIVESPAKVNLHLGIGTKRPDGYHDLQTVFHTLGLADTLTFTLHEPGDGFQPPADSLDGVSLTSDPHFDFPLAKNLIFRALDSLARALDRPIVEPGWHLHIHVDKRIPAQAGLGGGSSNAAAALLAACEFWGIDPLDPVCLEVAGKLGADVAFFLYGGCAFMDGKGEVMRERFDALGSAVLIINTGEGVSTAAAYKLFDQDPPAAASIEPLIQALRAPAGPQRERAVAKLLYNNLEPAAFQLAPSLNSLDTFLNGMDTVLYRMSGSGSAFFIVCPDEASVPDALVQEVLRRAPRCPGKPLSVIPTRFVSHGVRITGRA
ncbi:MAG: 4-(cytidine 5'-diphospho)-2-C-methyl-D-erythritol kinase [Coriobacteriales bacterium]|nr:4-(cytidine 5'-diphospho)-2-C-methyl-D-erythritol kinase [Coriobacteriales bacterium]